MKEEKIPKQKPHTSFNRCLSVAKNPEGNMTTAKKNVKNFILHGEHDKGEYGKGYYGKSAISCLIYIESIILLHIFFLSFTLVARIIYPITPGKGV